MTKAEVESKVRGILRESLGISEDEAKPEANLVDDLGADSLDVVEVVMTLEEEFNFEIADDSCDKVKTVSDLVDLVASLIPGGVS